MVFVTFCLLDYGFQGVIGFLDYFYTILGDDTYLFELHQERHYLNLGISCFSVFLLAFVAPVWTIQVINIIKGGPKPVIDEKSVQNLPEVNCEASDTGSMFLRPSSDWNPTSLTNQPSFLVPKKFQKPESSCCYTRLTENSEGLLPSKE
jgi:hypothetical protein